MDYRCKTAQSGPVAYTSSRSMTNPNSFVVQVPGRLQTRVTRVKRGWSVAVMRRNPSGTLTPVTSIRVAYWDDAIAAIAAGRAEIAPTTA